MKKLDPDLLARRTGRMAVPEKPATEKEKGKEPTDIEAKLANLDDIPEASPVAPGVRILGPGYLKPGVELNSMRPVQRSGPIWHVKAYPFRVIMPADMSLGTLPGGTVVAGAEVTIEHPFEGTYAVDDYGLYTEPFDAINPNLSIDTACTGGVIPISDYLMSATLMVFPHPDADYTQVRVQIRNAAGALSRVYMRHAASKTLFGAASPVYGKAVAQLDDHVIDGQPYGHAVAPATGSGGSGGGVWSDTDGYSHSVGRSVDQIAPDAGPAIIKLYARNPITRIPGGGGWFYTPSAWGVRMR